MSLVISGSNLETSTLFLRHWLFQDQISQHYELEPISLEEYCGMYTYMCKRLYIFNLVIVKKSKICSTINKSPHALDSLIIIFVQGNIHNLQKLMPKVPNFHIGLKTLLQKSVLNKKKGCWVKAKRFTCKHNIILICTAARSCSTE